MFLALLFGLSQALVTEIVAHEEHCYYESLNGACVTLVGDRRRWIAFDASVFVYNAANDAFTVRFQVKKGGFLDIDLLITAPSEKVPKSFVRMCSSDDNVLGVAFDSTAN
jgi:hypothetical protein